MVPGLRFSAQLAASVTVLAKNWTTPVAQPVGNLRPMFHHCAVLVVVAPEQVSDFGAQRPEVQASPFEQLLPPQHSCPLPPHFGQWPTPWLSFTHALPSLQVWLSQQSWPGPPHW